MDKKETWPGREGQDREGKGRIIWERKESEGKEAK